MRAIQVLTVLALVVFTAGLAGAQTSKSLVLKNGVDARIDVPDHDTLTPASGITIEAWITYDGSTLGSGYRWPTIVRKNPTPGQETYLLRVGAANTKNTNIEWKVVTSSGTVFATSRFTAGTLKTWTHIAATFDGQTANIFLNGKNVGSNSLFTPGTISNDNGVLRIGNGDTSNTLNPGSETWNGAIDELRIWPVARKRSEILATMSREIGFVPGEVSTWNMNGSGKDSSGGNDGTPNKNAAFQAAGATLTSSIFGAAFHGTGTSGCSGVPMALTASYPQVGNGFFTLHCIRATAKGSGFVALTSLKLTNPLKVLGASAWVSPAGALFLPQAGGLNNTVRTNIAIPNVPALAGQKIYAQYFWIESGCKVPLFASQALELTFQK